MKLFPPISGVALDEDVFHPELHGIHAQALGDFVHLLLASPGALGNSVASIGAGDRFVGVHRVAVDFDVGDAIRPRRWQTTPYTNRRALLRISPRTPVDGHFAR